MPDSRRGQLSTAGDGPHLESLLATVTATTPVTLRGRLQRRWAEDEASGDHTEPVIYLNELPREALAGGIIDVAARAAADQGLIGVRSGDLADPSSLKAIGVVAISALSTLRLDLTTDDAILDAVYRRLDRFNGPQWTEALDSLYSRTEELFKLLSSARGKRRQGWQRVAIEDRMVAEAVAAAVVGGAALASGVAPHQWLFPFRLFCLLGTSAAEDALSTIEQWLGTEFMPGPHTLARRAGLAELVASEAIELARGCACKDDIDPSSVGFTPRGACRQIDHDIRRWRPGERKPGSGGSRFADTLWGWLRRWLGGPGAGTLNPTGRPRLRPNDVAGSVIARKWLVSDHGAGGPRLVYDRVLPEFCRNCGEKPKIKSVSGETGRTQIQRVCCKQPRLVYRSDFSTRGGRRVLEPKLGIILHWAEGTSGYQSTAPLGQLWVCDTCGRYSLSEGFCPAPGCGFSMRRHHPPLRHAWVLLPLGDAWADLTGTAKPADVTPGLVPERTLGEPDLEYLRTQLIRLQPHTRSKLATPEDIWAVAKNWSEDEASRFRDNAEVRGLELLLVCKEIATGGSASAEGTGDTRLAHREDDG